MRLIDADEAIDALGKEGLITAMVIIDRLPSAQPEQVTGKLNPEQPDVIHCKDCINWQREWESTGKPGTHYCDMVDNFFDGDWYCADAEKRG